jgi:hypothetical protein
MSMTTHDEQTQHKRRSSDFRLDDIERRLVEGDLRMAAIEKELKANTEITSEIRDVMRAGRIGLQVLGGIGTLVKWIASIGAAIGSLYAMYYALRHGTAPPPPT